MHLNIHQTTPNEWSIKQLLSPPTLYTLHATNSYKTTLTVWEEFKASFSFHKLIQKETLKRLPYILICHCTSLSPRLIILDKNNLVNVSHHYLTSG